jgi:hypothetical protein
VFENRALRRIFGPNRDEVTGGWRKLHNVELRNLYRMIKLVKEDEVGGPTETSRLRWECNIKMNLKEIGCECVNSIHFVQSRDH